MTRDQLLAHCLAKPGAWEDEPWEGDVVAKVGDKIFAFLGDDSVGLKCGRTREDADELIARYPGDVTVMAYIGRHGWNTVRLDGAVDDAELVELIDASYDASSAGCRNPSGPTHAQQVSEPARSDVIMVSPRLDRREPGLVRHSCTGIAKGRHARLCPRR